MEYKTNGIYSASSKWSDMMYVHLDRDSSDAPNEWTIGGKLTNNDEHIGAIYGTPIWSTKTAWP